MKRVTGNPLSSLTDQGLQDVCASVDDLAFSGHEGGLVIATVVGQAAADEISARGGLS
jgi:hypothetical protein